MWLMACKKGSNLNFLALFGPLLCDKSLRNNKYPGVGCLCLNYHWSTSRLFNSLNNWYIWNWKQVNWPIQQDVWEFHGGTKHFLSLTHCEDCVHKSKLLAPFNTFLNTMNSKQPRSSDLKFQLFFKCQATLVFTLDNIGSCVWNSSNKTAVKGQNS